MPEPRPQADEVLLALLQSSDKAESERITLRIISEHAEPVIREIIKYKLRVPSRSDRNGNTADAEDIYNDVMVELIKRLDEFKADPARHAIGRLRSYVAVITYHACYRHLRRVYPQRHLLKNRLRYLLTHQAGFALWEGEDKALLCGFAAWRVAGRSASGGDKLRRLGGDRTLLAEAGLLAADPASSTPAELLAALFAYANGPLEFDELVNTVAHLWNLRDGPLASETYEEMAEPSTDVDVAGALDRREYLSKLWAEILELPLRQRVALLLNLRGAEGRGCIELFQLAGVASVEQMAKGLEMPVEQLAAIWNELPFDDLQIAGRLGLSRQQVINLRKSARERLSRKMKSFE